MRPLILFCGPTQGSGSEAFFGLSSIKYRVYSTVRRFRVSSTVLDIEAISSDFFEYRVSSIEYVLRTITRPVMARVRHVTRVSQRAGGVLAESCALALIPTEI